MMVPYYIEWMAGTNLETHPPYYVLGFKKRTSFNALKFEEDVWLEFDIFSTCMTYLEPKYFCPENFASRGCSWCLRGIYFLRNLRVEEQPCSCVVSLHMDMINWFRHPRFLPFRQANVESLLILLTRVTFTVMMVNWTPDLLESRVRTVIMNWSQVHENNQAV